MTPRSHKFHGRTSNDRRPEQTSSQKYIHSTRRLVYDPALPIIDKKDEIIQAIIENPVVIVSGETGSGKTTQLPKFCMEAGRGIDGVIGCTQPRRIAAITLAGRIAEELGETVGQSVGYKIRFTDRFSRQSRIKIMTDGILLAETLGDHELSRYDTLIVDEAHERSLNIDFLLGIVRTLIRKRNNLKLIIASATIDTEKFSRCFDNAPVIEVSGRMYPVEVQYLSSDLSSAFNETAEEFTPVELAAQAVDRLCRQSHSGDVLIFMPTEQDIRETCEWIENNKYRGVVALPLFARLSAQDQARVFLPANGRKIIVATNIAETSLTIPGVKYVIDTGLARISQYNPRSRTTSLQIRPISKSSADQRKGRCGRMENGICIRLYSEAEYLSRPQFTRPEILRSNLAQVILRMLALKLGAIEDFPFIDRPDPGSVKDGLNLLMELGAIRKPGAKDQKPEGETEVPDDGSQITNSSFVLTEQGRFMSRIPVDPRLSCILLQSRIEGCISETMVIAAALCIQDPRERPVDKVQQADAAHRIFADPLSDFIGLLNIWTHCRRILEQENAVSQLRKFCSRHFLSFKRIREWMDVHSQLYDISKEYGLISPREKVLPTSESELVGRTQSKNRISTFLSVLNDAGVEKTASVRAQFKSGRADFSDLYCAIHRSVTCGFLSNIAMKKEKNIFRGTRDKEVMVFPGSTLFNRAGNWIVAAEMVETSRLFARVAANIDPEWLEELGKPLCRYSWSQAHWERNRGEVVALEQVSLFGLIIVSNRQVCYGRVDPVESSNIFVRSALVENDVKNLLSFMIHNRNLIDEVRDIENRVRRRNILIGEDELYEFYRQRIPDNIYDIRTFGKYLKDKGSQDFLCMNQEDLIQFSPDPLELELYPDHLKLGNHVFSCLYQFEPGSPEDGLTVQIPSTAAASVPKEDLNWMVPGLFREKVNALVKALPKVYRKQLVPVSQTVDIILNGIPRNTGALANILSQFIYQQFGVDIPAAAWSEDSLPDYLKMRIAITGPEGHIISSGRDISVLENQKTEGISSTALYESRMKWERNAIVEWDMGSLPQSIDINGEGKGHWILFPALVQDTEQMDSIGLQLFEDQTEALAAHCQGVAALAEIVYSKEMKFLRKFLTVPRHMSLMVEQWMGVKRFQKKLYQTTLTRLFSSNIRSGDDFHAYVEKTLPDMPSFAQKLMTVSLEIVEAVVNAHSDLDNLIRNNLSDAAARQFWMGLKEELDKLIPENFMMLYEPERLSCLIRYIRAITIRAQRAWLDIEKYQNKTNEINKLADKRYVVLKELSLQASHEKKIAADELFWMIEEYKVSVYAQELKTAFPISRKRIEKAFQEIDRMI